MQGLLNLKEHQYIFDKEKGNFYIFSEEGKFNITRDSTLDILQILVQYVSISY